MPRSPEEIKAWHRAYYQRNRAKLLEQHREYRRAHPTQRRDWGRANPEKLRRQNLRRWYGITLEEVERIRAKQENACAICKKIFSDTPSVDHCHKSGKVRGLLCKRCNVKLTHLEQPGWTEVAQQYLNDHQNKEAA